MPNSLFESLILRAEQFCVKSGLGALRPLQREVLVHLAQKNSVFAGLPTGYGKSLCYLIPAAAWGWRVIVICPLVSLIEDQAKSAEDLGLRILPWRGALSRTEKQILGKRLEAGDWNLCLLSAERFNSWNSSGYLAALEGFGVYADLLVVDEMHCLEEWRTFRKGYDELGEGIRRETGSGACLLGLSASLPEREARVWMEELCGAHQIVTGGIGRDNLELSVIPLEEEHERWVFLLSALRGLNAPESALVYCKSRDEVDEVAQWLRCVGLEAVSYHAGLPAEERSARSRAFRMGHLRVVCATSAFGMGIDYAHVSRVIHFSMPRDLESYWQEVGRAGRNGSPASGIVFWRRSEIGRLNNMDARSRKKFLELWRAWASNSCRKSVVENSLGLVGGKCGCCDRCSGRDVVAGMPRRKNVWWTEKTAELSRWVNDCDRACSTDFF